MKRQGETEETKEETTETRIDERDWKRLKRLE